MTDCPFTATLDVTIPIDRPTFDSAVEKAQREFENMEAKDSTLTAVEKTRKGFTATARIAIGIETATFADAVERAHEVVVRVAEDGTPTLVKIERNQ